MTIEIPGYKSIEIHHLLLDYNGTLAIDGHLTQGVAEKIYEIAKTGIDVHIITADTNGTVRQTCRDLPVQIEIFENTGASESKRKVASKLGVGHCACIGNGYNDRHMFEACALSIAVIGSEGCSVGAIMQADIVCKHILEALDLILSSNRVIATLRD